MRTPARGSSPAHTLVGRRGATVCLLLAMTLLAACQQASQATAKHGTPTATATTAGHGSTPFPGATASVTTQAPPANSPFVCANPAGSSLTYAFVNADRQIYMVTGCSQPIQLTHIQRPDTYSLPLPVAWSPSHRYLAFAPDLQQDACTRIVDTTTDATVSTRFGCYNGDPSTSGDLRTFIGWLDDNTFLGRIDLADPNAPNPVRIVRVDSHSQAETTVAAYAWMSNPQLRGNALFFGGRVNPNDTTAYLYRLSLADGGATKLVSLGLSGNGGCQVGPGPCSWTAWWDVSADGAHVVYHNPGADSFPSDVHSPADTPVYYANVDGSGATRVLAGQWSNLIAPQFDPSGMWIYATVPGSNNNADIIYQSLGGSLQRIASAYTFAWRPDGQAIVNVVPSYQGNLSYSQVTLLTLATQARTPLAANTYFYLWAS